MAINFTPIVQNNTLASQFGQTGNFNQLPAAKVAPTTFSAPLTPTVTAPKPAPVTVTPTGGVSFTPPKTVTPALPYASVAAANPASSAGINFSTPSYQGGTPTTPAAKGIYGNPNMATVDSSTGIRYDSKGNVIPAVGGLGSLVTTQSNTPSGGTMTTDASGNTTNFTPAPGFSVDTSGSIPSSALGSGTSTGDLQNSHARYSDYVDAVAQAQGYSPAYIQAQQGVFDMQTRDAALQQNQISGQGFAGATADYAANVTNRARSMNAIEGLQSQQALDVQSLIRQGNISAAQTQLQYSPTGMVGQQAITQYQQLGQLYPGAAIPPLDPSQDPQAQLQMARQLVANSPAYQAGFQSTYTTATGGTGIYSKLDVNSGAFQKNSDGTYTLVSGAAAALAAANQGVLVNNVGALSKIQTAINSTTGIMTGVTAFMNQYGLNQSGIAVISQLQQQFRGQTGGQDVIAKWNNDLTALREDYAQYITARGGSVQGTGADDPAVLQAIPNTVSLAQLQGIVGSMQDVGAATAASTVGQVNQALQGLQNNTAANAGAGSTSGGGTSNASSGWNF